LLSLNASVQLFLLSGFFRVLRHAKGTEIFSGWFGLEGQANHRLFPSKVCLIPKHELERVSIQETGSHEGKHDAAWLQSTLEITISQCTFLK
jgi:hypothetical protein